MVEILSAMALDKFGIFRGVGVLYKSCLTVDIIKKLPSCKS